jgi:hypothetical protein
MLVLVLAAGLLAACDNKGGSGSGEYSVTVSVDGTNRVHTYSRQMSVGQFLQSIGVTVNDLDQVNPPLYTQLANGMRITVSRVVERTECEDQPVEPNVIEQPTHQLAAGERQVIQTGVAGVETVCYRIVEQDDQQIGDRSESSRTPKVAARDEVIAVGVAPPNTSVPIDGRLAFISGGQAIIIDNNTNLLRPLTSGEQLDKRVFDLSADGRRLVYTVSTADPNDPEFSNELWAVLNTGASAPDAVQLVPTDVIYAQWVPGRENPAVSYSTASPVNDVPNWQAYNDLYVMELDPSTGETAAVDDIVPQNSIGAYAYWGRRYRWSDDGTQVAWALADSVGLVNLETGDFQTLLSFPEYATALVSYWVWVPTLSWSEDGHLITTIHGAPYGSESSEDSIIFDTAVANPADSLLIAPFLTQTGIWTTPTYSPPTIDAVGDERYSIAYFQARDPLNSPGAQYDLWIADSDGSNARLVFPGSSRSGLRPDPEDGIAWSPTGRQIALIYQSNLWIVDVQTGEGTQITSDGQSSRPRWSREP